MAFARSCSRAVVRLAASGTLRVSRLHASAAARAAGLWRRGLVNAASTEDFYTQRLELADAAQIAEERGYLWGAAVADAAERGIAAQLYMAGVVAAAQEFMLKRELHDRDAVRRQLEMVLRAEGSFALVLGGKVSITHAACSSSIHGVVSIVTLTTRDLCVQSVGKSFLLRKVSADLQKKPAGEADTAPKPRRTVTYDARLYGSDLTKGIMKAINAQLPPTFMNLMREGFGRVVMVSTLGVTAATGVKLDPSKVKDVVVPTPEPTLEDVLTQFVAACEAEGTYPCLVIDEANAALVATTPAERDRAIEALRALTQFTKQEQRMNVVLAASEHSEPFRLNELGCSSTHWTNTLIVGEVRADVTYWGLVCVAVPEAAPTQSMMLPLLQVPPADMRDLLMAKWGMGPNLADACMSVWGGENQHAGGSWPRAAAPLLLVHAAGYHRSSFAWLQATCGARTKASGA